MSRKKLELRNKIRINLVDASTTYLCAGWYGRQEVFFDTAALIHFYFITRINYFQFHEDESKNLYPYRCSSKLKSLKKT